MIRLIFDRILLLFGDFLMKLSLFLILMSFSSVISALGQTEHRITGEIAERHINEHTKQAIRDIIGYESLAEASNYADEMRSNPAEYWQKIAGSYHYVTIPKGKTYNEVGAPPKGDAVLALNKFAKTLRDPNSSRADKALALKFAIHIIGDLHQPLHAGNGTDRGGNDIKLKFFGKDTNLHRLWDKGLTSQRQLSYTEWSNWLDKEITSEDIKSWQTSDPLVWIEESVKIRDTIYPKKDSLSYDYLYHNLPIIKRRLKQAGIRMAFYLDELFKKQ